MLSLAKIFVLIPSKLTTHYHIRLKAYLSICEGDIYCWCFVSEEWVRFNASIEGEPILNLTDIKQNDVSRYFQTACFCSEEGNIEHYVNSDGVFFSDCDSCSFYQRHSDFDSALAFIKE